MGEADDDPLTRWYAAYQTTRAERRAELVRLRARRRIANRVAGVLIGYMLAGGVLASLAVRLVMAN